MITDRLESILIRNVLDTDHLTVRSGVGVGTDLNENVLFCVRQSGTTFVVLGNSGLLGETGSFHFNAISSLVAENKENLLPFYSGVLQRLITCI